VRGNRLRRRSSQTVPPRLQGLEGEPNGAARAGGFSLHAGVGIAPNQREKLERLCRYVSRPPVASKRLALTASGQVRYMLKTPYQDGTTHIVLEPLDLMARLAAPAAAQQSQSELPLGARGPPVQSRIGKIAESWSQQSSGIRNVP